MKKTIILTALTLSISICYSQVFKPTNMNADFGKVLSAMPSFSTPTIEVKTTAGKKIKTLKSPHVGVFGNLTLDEKYVILYNMNNSPNIYRVSVETSEIIEVPVEMQTTDSDGKTNRKKLLLFFGTNSDKAYLYEKKDFLGKSINETIDIYEVDFTTKKCTLHMSIPNTSSKVNVWGAHLNNYLLISRKTGEIELFDVVTKSYFSTIDLKLKLEDWMSLPSTTVITNLAQNTLNYQIYNKDLKKKVSIYYNIPTGKIVHQETREGADYEVQYLHFEHSDTQLWTKKIKGTTALNASTIYYTNSSLTEELFTKKGVMMWFPASIENQIKLIYLDGKIETYNVTTKKLLKTETSGAGLNDF